MKTGPHASASNAAQTNVLPKDRVYELVYALPFGNTLKDRTVFLFNQAWNQLINELNIQFLRNLPRLFEYHATDLVSKQRLFGGLFSQQVQ